MKYVLVLASAFSLLASCAPVNNSHSGAHNDGWQSLFDGKTTKGWHTFNKTDAGAAWKAEDGVLHLDAAQKEGRGDLVTDEVFSNFDFKYEWKIANGGNSGVMFYVQEDPQFAQTYYTGPEMQVLDNEGHADAKIHKHRAGDLYDLIASSKESVKPAGEWNQAEITCVNGKLNLYLNGVNVVSTTMWDDAWTQLLAGSKFKTMPGFGQFKNGRIALQDHGDEVWFKNIKVKKL